MRLSKVGLAVCGIVSFSSGLVVGQGVRGPRRFAKYENPAHISAMDWALLQATVLRIRDDVPGEITPPSLVFDSGSGKIKAIQVVMPSLSGEQLGAVRNKLMGDAIHTVASVQNFVPEATEKDVEIVFRSWNDKGEFYVFAEYRYGTLTFQGR